MKEFVFEAPSQPPKRVTETCEALFSNADLLQSFRNVRVNFARFALESMMPESCAAVINVMCGDNDSDLPQIIELERQAWPFKGRWCEMSDSVRIHGPLQPARGWPAHLGERGQHVGSASLQDGEEGTKGRADECQRAWPNHVMPFLAHQRDNAPQHARRCCSHQDRGSRECIASLLGREFPARNPQRGHGLCAPPR